MIRLPLSAQDARTLADQSRKAPFGKNTETLIDQTARKTWEIGAESIEFQNLQWPYFVDRLAKRVARE
jgi:hypothetical protein